MIWVEGGLHRPKWLFFMGIHVEN